MNPYLEMISAKANENFRKSDKDYLKDGLYYCGVCNEPKQTFVTLPGTSENKIVPVACECSKKEENELKQKENNQKIKKEKEECFSGVRAFSQTFENDDQTNKDISNKLKENYVLNFEQYRKKGIGVLLCGGTGTGKTFLARATGHALIEKGYRGKEINLSVVYSDTCYSAEKKAEFLKELLLKHFIIIDDLGTERQSEAINEFVYIVINTLYEHQIPVIYTSNIALNQFKNPNGDTSIARIFSRIYGSTLNFEVNNGNKRLDDLRKIHSLWTDNSTKV